MHFFVGLCMRGVSVRRTYHYVKLQCGVTTKSAPSDSVCSWCVGPMCHSPGIFSVPVIKNSRLFTAASLCLCHVYYIICHIQFNIHAPHVLYKCNPWFRRFFTPRCRWSDATFRIPSKATSLPMSLRNIWCECVCKTNWVAVAIISISVSIFTQWNTQKRFLTL